MVTSCAAGHLSASDDYCDECGRPLAGAGDPNGVTNQSHRTELVPAEAPGRESCARCCTPRAGDDQFCEGCGYDFKSAPGGLRRRWIAVIDVDQAHFQRTAPPELTFPASRAPSTVELDSDEVLIGRRSESRGIRPDIDLSDLLDDPAVSHRHARLTRTDDGSYAVTDLGSTNGTAFNDDARLLEANVPVALSDADRILLGAWTVITFRPGPHRSPL